MTNYYPYPNRKSLLERCLFDAFKDEWITQSKNMIEKTKESSTKENTKNPYESFNLKRLNQTFDIGDSDIFTSATSFFKDMFDVAPNAFHTESGNSRKYLHLNSYRFDTVWFDVTQLENKMTYTDAIKLIHALYLANQESIYGVLMHDGKSFINPLHPLNAQAIVKKFIMEEHQAEATDLQKIPYKIFIYTYKNRKSYEQRTEYFNKDLEQVFTNHILSVLAMLDIPTEKYTKILNVTNISEITSKSNNINANDVSVFKDLKYIFEEVVTGKDDISIQPVQLVNTGVAYPYYGIVAEKYNNSSLRGFQLSPMLSCNVGFPEVSITQNTNVNVAGLSVCTGNFSNRSTDGRLSLNHANLGSPYFQQILTYGCFTFADIAVKISLGIYAEFFGLEKIDFIIKHEEKVPVSFKEFKEKNPEASLTQYIEALKKN